jgi:hypothetical protein
MDESIELSLGHGGDQLTFAGAPPMNRAAHTPWRKPLMCGGVAEWLKAAVC